MESFRSNGSVVELEIYRTQVVSENPSISQLDTITGSQSGNEVDAISGLEPADRGIAAWRLICVAFVFEALLWGESAIARSFSSG